MILVRPIKPVILAAFLAVTVVGCGGFAASKSVSPASFFLPGLIQNTPASESPLDRATNASPDITLVQAR
jgi:hypothetical protein